MLKRIPLYIPKEITINQESGPNKKQLKQKWNKYRYKKVKNTK